MQEVRVYLNSIDRVKKFVYTISKFDAEFDLISGRYVIDAKSIMGIFSLDLSKTQILQITNATKEVMAAIAEFMVEE
jgi:phosphocarrier protein HPr